MAREKEEVLHHDKIIVFFRTSSFNNLIIICSVFSLSSTASRLTIVDTLSQVAQLRVLKCCGGGSAGSEGSLINELRLRRETKLFPPALCWANQLSHKNRKHLKIFTERWWSRHEAERLIYSSNVHTHTKGKLFQLRD